MLDILYQDDHLIVINKPSGIPVHAGSGGGKNLEDYFHQLQGDAKHPPMLAHRLDRDTSGCLILGRNKQALRVLGRLFEQRRISKTYWALTNGVPPFKQGRIDAPMAKQTADKRRWHMKIDPSGQPAVTDYQVMGSDDMVAWLALRPKTGRTHQLRVHCAHMGWPMIGDRFYGDPETTLPLMLHAASIVIPFEQGKEPVRVTAPPPNHMMAYLQLCGYSGFSVNSQQVD